MANDRPGQLELPYDLLLAGWDLVNPITFPFLPPSVLLCFSSHYLLLVQTSLVIPEDEGFCVYASTQWTQMTQAAVAAVMGIKDSRQWVVQEVTFISARFDRRG